MAITISGRLKLPVSISIIVAFQYACKHVSQCLRNKMSWVGRKLHFIHLSLLIAGPLEAKEGLDKILRPAELLKKTRWGVNLNLPGIIPFIRGRR